MNEFLIIEEAIVDALEVIGIFFLAIVLYLLIKVAQRIGETK